MAQDTWQPDAFGTPPQVGDCQVFPADNPWNWDISDAPVHPMSDAYIASISNRGPQNLHPDFGENPAYGFPYQIVDARQPPVPIVFTDYADESDPGPYPIPPDARTESGDDKHVIVVDGTDCMLYELYLAERAGDGWTAASGAVFDLGSNALRPMGWTSADAAGLPIFPGLARYEEVASGEIRHALRFTVQQTQRAFIPPATHWASLSDNPDLPPMGLRLRLRADFDIAAYSGQARVILQALQRYGMILADNGANWFISGAPSPDWNDAELNQLKRVPGTAFEAVLTGPLVRPGDF